MRLSELTRIVDGYVEQRAGELVSACARLINIKSETGEEYEAQLEVRRMMEETGLSVDFWEPDDRELRASPLFSETGESFVHRPVCAGVRKGLGGGRSLLVNGHVDTVNEFPIEKWVSDPFAADIRDGRIYGRGASDMKSGLAMALFALRGIGELGIELDGDVVIVSVPAEENGGNGTVAALVRGYRADAAIYPEPTSNFIQPAHRGAAFWRIHVDGKASHGGTKYKGVSAVEKGMKVAQKLSELEAWRDEHICKKHPLYKGYPLSAPVTLGIFRGGQFTSGVPETCMLEAASSTFPARRAGMCAGCSRTPSKAPAWTIRGWRSIRRGSSGSACCTSPRRPTPITRSCASPRTAFKGCSAKSRSSTASRPEPTCG
ncbi:MAG: M20/M25/M40 family metallo-hydrolase [Clostridiales bacterium]|nr:M20/M25/M40 family metallo-hydrolase [Clostridiales bacterium]